MTFLFYYTFHSLKYCMPYTCFSKLKSNILADLNEDFALPFRLVVLKNKQKKKKKTGMRITSLKGNSLARTTSTHQLQQDVGFLPLTFFHSQSHLWTVEAKGAGWWSVPVQPMLGNCQDYNTPLLVGLAAMPRAEWATETELVMTTAGSSWTSRSPPHHPHPPSPPRHPGMTAWKWRCSEASHQHAAPSWLMENFDFVMISLFQ